MQLNQKPQRHKDVAGISQKSSILGSIATVLFREAQALSYLTQNIPETTQFLVEQILKTRGKIVFAGLGKSWHVGQKLAATFSSSGTPAICLHAGEALHGDLGIVQADDLVIILSKSGTGNEFEYLFSFLRLQGTFTALICCNKGSLSSYADLVIQLPLEREACELNLAPTSSSTITMAFGDALAIVVGQLKGFSKVDFARYHPSGALGRRLLYTVSSLMHPSEALPFVLEETKFGDFLYTITSKKMGVGIVVDKNNYLKGIITDGDLRRACQQGQQVFNCTAHEIMTRNPKKIQSSEMAHTALEVMEQYDITSLVVTEKEVVVGLIHIHDLLKAGIKS